MSRPLPTLVAASLLLLAALSPASGAAAQESSGEDLERANTLYEQVRANLSAAQPDLPEDERLLVSAIELADRPQYRYVLAVVLRLAGRLEEAWQQLDRASRMPGSREFEESIQAERRNLEPRLHIVEVSGSTGESELRVYRRRLSLEEGTRRLALVPGEHELLGYAEGRSAEAQQVEARAGGRSSVSFDLPEGASDEGAGQSRSVVEEPWFWAFVGALAVGVGVSVGLAVGLSEGQGETYGGTTGVRFTP